MTASAIGNVDDYWNQPRSKNVHAFLSHLLNLLVFLEMSGRDSLLRGFEDTRKSSAHLRLVPSSKYIRGSSSMISSACKLGVPDSVVYNALVLSYDFVSQRSSKQRTISADDILILALRFSVFSLKRSDIMTLLTPAESKNISLSQRLRLTMMAELELLTFCECRVWYTDNIFEILRELLDKVLPGFQKTKSILDVSTSVCWVLLASDLVSQFSAYGACISVIACSIALLCHCERIEYIIDHLLEAFRDHIVINDSRIQLNNPTRRLFTYIVD